jgi:addiction module HigA family antidote
MKRQKAPPHPGEVLREYLGDVSVAEAAEKLVVGRSTLSRLLSGDSGVSADMAIRLGMALRTAPELWAGLQWKFDLHLASLRRRPTGVRNERARHSCRTE